MERKRKTVGQASYEASRDFTKYDPLEIGYALSEDVVYQLQVCGERHSKVFDEDEYFLILIRAKDPLIAGLVRHKYAAFLYMPMPRPWQSVYLYNRKSTSIKRLWSLPTAEVMAVMSDMKYVAPQWKQTKGWCDAFYHGWTFDGENMINKTPTYFFDYIRRQHGINHLSEREYLNANREELIKAGGKNVETLPSDSFDFSKVATEKVVDSLTSIAN